MKIFTYRPVTWAALFVFLLHTNHLQADAWVKFRGKCRPWLKEWKTRAWVDNLPDSGGPHINVDYDCNKRDKSCTKAVSNCYWDDRTRTRAYAVGGDRVRISDGDSPFSAEIVDYTFADYEIVARCLGSTGTIIGGGADCYGNDAAGFNRILLPADQTSYHITKPFLEEPTRNSRGHISITDSKPIYNEADHTIIIKNLKGVLGMRALDIANDFAAFTISVTHEPQSYVESEDPYKEEREYMENLVWSSTAILNNGRVRMDGAFRSSSFEIMKNDGPQSEVTVELNIKELIIPIPKDISLDEVSVNFGVDGGNLGYGISNKFTVRNPTDQLIINPFFTPEETFTFENYPNAVSDVLNIKVELPYSQETTIVLMDVNGDMVKQIYEGGIHANREFVFQESLSDLNEGIYFLVMEVRNQLLVRKVIVNH